MTFWHSRQLRPPQIVWPSLADMLRPSMQTLKHIVVNIHFCGDDDDPVPGILSVFKDMQEMSTKNIIETVSIGISDKRLSNRRHLDWGRLNEVLTTPGWVTTPKWYIWKRGAP